MRWGKYLIVMTIILVSLLPYSVLVSADSWVHYPYSVSSIIPYDFDGDNITELVALPSYVVDNFAVLDSPYPKYKYGLVLDADYDGILDIVLYNDAGNYVIYNGLRKLGEFSLGNGSVVSDLTYKAMAVNNRVLFGMKVYTFNGSNVYPVVDRGNLYAVYRCDEYICLEDTLGKVTRIYAANTVIVGAYMNFFTLYVFGNGVNGGVLIKYSLFNNTLTITGYQTSIKRVISVISSNAFLVEGDEGVYTVTDEYALLVVPGRLLGYNMNYLFMYYRNKLNIVKIPGYIPVKSVYLPKSELPIIVNGAYPYVVCVYDDGLYLLSFAPDPSIYVNIPSTTTVGEKTYYSVYAYDAKELYVSVDGIPVPQSGHIVFNTTGKHVFTVSASNGVKTVSLTREIYVYPRPISIYLRVLNTPEAFKTVRAVVDVTDTISGSIVNDISCTVMIRNETISVKAGAEFNILLIPDGDSTSLPVYMVCGDNEKYKQTAQTQIIKLEPTVADLDIKYPSPGSIEIILRKMDVVASGTAYIVIDGKGIQTTLPNKINITPGTHTIDIYFAPSSPIFRNAEYHVKLNYYADITSITTSTETTVLVADKVETVTVTMTTPTTVIQRIDGGGGNTTQSSDSTLSIIMGLGGLGGGLVVGYLIRGMSRKKKTTKVNELEVVYEEYEKEVSNL